MSACSQIHKQVVLSCLVEQNQIKQPNKNQVHKRSSAQRAGGRGKENSAKRRRVNLTFPIPGASMEKQHISNFCFSAAGGNSLVSLT